MPVCTILLGKESWKPKGFISQIQFSNSVCCSPGALLQRLSQLSSGHNLRKRRGFLVWRMSKGCGRLTHTPFSSQFTSIWMQLALFIPIPFWVPLPSSFLISASSVTTHPSAFSFQMCATFTPIPDTFILVDSQLLKKNTTSLIFHRIWSLSGVHCVCNTSLASNFSNNMEELEICCLYSVFIF